MGIIAASAQSHRRLPTIAFFAWRQTTNDQWSKYLFGTGGRSVRLVCPGDRDLSGRSRLAGAFNAPRSVSDGS
jgi:hypothetical protein